jgi:hypothetical protein
VKSSVFSLAKEKKMEKEDFMSFTYYNAFVIYSQREIFNSVNCSFALDIDTLTERGKNKIKDVRCHRAGVLWKKTCRIIIFFFKSKFCFEKRIIFLIFPPIQCCFE